MIPVTQVLWETILFVEGLIRCIEISLFDEEKRAALNGENNNKVNSIRENAKPWNRDTRPVLDEILRHFYRVL